MLRQCSTTDFLPCPNTFCIVGGLLSARRKFHAGGQTAERPPDRKHGEGYDRFPMGNGQAPGIDTGLGASGAGGSAAGWAVRVPGAVRRLWAAGFFLAAFTLADFLVGFFLPAVRAGVFAADLRPANRFVALRTSFFFVLGFFAARFRAAFLTLAMVPSCIEALSAKPRSSCSRRRDTKRRDQA